MLAAWQDRRASLVVLGVVVEDFKWLCHAYYLMRNGTIHLAYDRLHKALRMKYPGELYEQPSPRLYVGLSDVEYPFHDRSITVTQCGRICIGTRKINLSTAFAGQNIGVKQVADQVWLVSFMDYDLGFFDNETMSHRMRREPFRRKGVTHVSGIN